MPGSRVLAIGLDGYDLTVAESMMAEGHLPSMRVLRERSARVALEHGAAKYSGLTWEHFSSGRAPDNGGRMSAITFNPITYHVQQQPTSLRPFLADVHGRAVIFDLAYFDLSQAPNVRGITNWGAHDPGTREYSRPDELLHETQTRFGTYPAKEYIYGFLWPSAERTRLATEALERAVDVRADVARWLLAERCPDWDLGMVVVSETHSATEPMWHGLDGGHPLHKLASATDARAGLIKIYKAVDRLIGRLVDAFPDATVLLFAMHGMGPNESDVPAMLLLGELLFRLEFGEPYMQEARWPGQADNEVPLLKEDIHWCTAMKDLVPWPSPWSTKAWENTFGHLRVLPTRWPMVLEESGIDWMPTARYRPFWPHMSAFALPAFYDGRVRINLQGREGCGTVRLKDYGSVRAKIVECVEACVNALTGEKVVEETHYPDKDPGSLDETEADIYIMLRGSPCGFVHPTLGRIGPVPYFRSGGHTGGSGFLYAAGSDFSKGYWGQGSSFDVAPTIIELLNSPVPEYLTGRSLIARLSR